MCTANRCCSRAGGAGSKPRPATRNSRTSCDHGRVRNNVVSLLVTCAVLVAGVKFADGSFIRSINKISETLDRALFNVLEELGEPDYTPINVSATYYASTYFNPQGMAILYNITNIFMNAIVNKDIYPEGLILVQDQTIQLEPLKEHWQALLRHYAGLVTIVVILLVMAIFFPLCGMCFCCCRCCCGRCGAKSQPLDKKKDCCKKFMLATMLIVIGTLLLFGVVCAFVTNTNLYDGTTNVVPVARNNMRDVDTYLNTTRTEINILLHTNYQEFQTTLFDVLNKSSTIVYDQLAKYSNAVAMTEVTNIVLGLEDIKSNLTQMKNITNYLRNHASQLNDALRKVKKDLIYTLKECTTNAECSQLSSNVSNLDTNIDFNSLPDVTGEMKELEAVMDSNLTESVQQGQQTLLDIEGKIGNTVSTSLDSVRSGVNNAGREIKHHITDIDAVLKDVSTTMHENVNPVLADGERYIQDYAPYLYYGGIAVSSILLCVTFCITIGLICGICGKKTDPYSEDCCNKGVGNQCLMFGVAIMFLSGIILAVVTIVFFIVGVFGQRIVCDSFRNYKDSKVIDILDDTFSIRDASGGLDTSIKQILTDCHQNKSAYTAFGLRGKMDLDKIGNYLEEFDIDEALKELQHDINIDVSINILTDDAKTKLMELANSNISNINFDRFTAVLDDNLTKVDLMYLVKQLDVVIEAVSQKMVPDEIKANLQVSKLHLETYQDKLVVPMTQNAETLIDIAKNMEHNLKFGKQSFKQAITELIDEVENAELYLKQNGTQLLSAIATNFTLAIKGQVVGYLNRIVDNVGMNIGQCGPLSNVINATLTATCDKILLPINGLWFVLFWSLLIFTNAIVISVKLASLYKKYDPYSSYAGESEYLCDAYADREIIPLASNGKSSKKKKKNKRQDGRIANYPPEREGGDHGRRDYPSGSNQENRYADMAPKQQWEDFPNGGPPQYQRAPTEYERPPPYYYPGNSDQH